jgi:hypothetical protein
MLRELEQRPIVIVLVSPDALASEFVKKVLEMADTNDNRTIPVLIEPCRVRIGLTRLH